jgi:hypothetical protein
VDGALGRGVPRARPGGLGTHGRPRGRRARRPASEGGAPDAGDARGDPSDFRYATGIQFYRIGRFIPYPRAAWASCGDPAAGPGLIFSRRMDFERLDLGPARTVISGVAGPRVREVRLLTGGAPRRLELSPRRRAFLAVLAGHRAPADSVLEVRYTDGRRVRFAGSGAQAA